jgi:N4-(beta-N-acetylglucosaminyl)-L-asparaginase
VTTSRREFLERSAALAALGFTPRALAAAEPLLGATVALVAGTIRARPAVVASANGIRGVKVAYDRIAKGDDTLDAIIDGVKIQELDPTDQSVGLGGLPNEEGVVQLDASCMHGPTKRAGSVGCLEGIATPSMVAKAVMDYTDHIMLVGADAKRFALAMGFQEQNLLTDKSRQDWLNWKANRKGHDSWVDDAHRAAWLQWNADGRRKSEDSEAEGRIGSGPLNWTHGTINMDAVNAAGDISSITTTSGISWKVPGRVGDSPIIGAGQYCDNNVGAAGSTGRGEANIKVCGAFLAVEFMRTGVDPQTALMRVMERVIAMTEKRLLNDKGRPYFDLSFYAITKDGRYAGACAYEGGTFAVCDEKGPRIETAPYLFKRSEIPVR